MKIFKVLILISIISTLQLHAQKLPDIQQGNQWLTGIKIDGKLNEWPQPLKAYNKATHSWYSVANDDKNLYLAIKTDRAGKIISGGLTFIINQTAITYPYNKRRDRRLKENRTPLKPGDPIALSDFKEILLKGMVGIKDTLVSIYNPYGLKVSATEQYEKNDKHICYYEMVIPLKYLGHSIVNNQFNYKIRLNGIVRFGPLGGTLVPIPGKTAREMNELAEKIDDLALVTELSGIYILATKPINNMKK